MKVIIVGAGEIGMVSAETVSRIHDVLVIDKDETVSNVLKNRLSISTLKGDGTNPKVLEYAIINHQADMIISTLNDDASNLFVCIMAKRIKPDIKTVSSITNPDYRISTTADGIVGVDTIISPELITAEKMFRLCVLENAIDYEYIPQLDVAVAMFSVEPEHEVVGKICMLLDIPEDCTIFALYRDSVLHTYPETMEIHPGDHLYVMGSTESLNQFNSILGVEFPARNYVILGGSIVGRNVAKMLAEEKRVVKIIDRNEGLCKEMARSMPGVSVICADFVDPDIQVNENIFWADALVTTSHSDQTNLLMSMTAQKHNARKVITRYFTKEYEDVFDYTGIETIIGYYSIVSNEIAKCTNENQPIMMKSRYKNELFFTYTVDRDSPTCGRFLGDLHLPEGSRIIAVFRKDRFVRLNLCSELEEGDLAVVFSSFECIDELMRVLGKSKVPEV